jgi:catechol 2,3-dioxygenase-like lactoylglutathione lyase family enzyme
MRFEQAGLRVTNFNRSLRFYSRVLGLRLVDRGDTRGWGGGLWAQLEDPASRRKIEINWYPKGSRFYRTFRVGDGIDHLDFTVGVQSRAKFERTCRTLVRRGARPTRFTPATTEGWMASFLDPDGIWITVGRRPTPAERRAMATE